MTQNRLLTSTVLRIARKGVAQALLPAGECAFNSCAARLVSTLVRDRTPSTGKSAGAADGASAPRLLVIVRNTVEFRARLGIRLYATSRAARVSKRL